MIQERIINSLAAVMPYPNQMCDFDLKNHQDLVIFTWRGARFRVGYRYECFELDEDQVTASGTPTAILLRSLLVSYDKGVWE